ncbi:MAG: protein-glutamate O-methyltransferase CheR [Xanthomonadales bacterium]|nr:protein-glutamate O-methyltransferase CheR [Xanthomonadales bacterium]
MDESEFRRWVRLLEERTGVVVPPERKQFLETNLRLRMRELEIDTFADYYAQRLSGRKGAVEWAVLVDRLTVHQTHFFRHMPSLELVRDAVLPDFLMRRRRGAAFHAWSVGCSTGEEAYSLAMVIDRFCVQADQVFHYGITASDVSKAALDVGREGVYRRQKLSEIPPDYRERYCEPCNGDEFQISDRLLRRVGFAMLNMLDISRQPLSHIDLIYCQNVMIYFPKDRRHQVLDQLVDCLGPGGYLILGPGEMTGWTHPQLIRVPGQRTLAYRRRPEE